MERSVPVRFFRPRTILVTVTVRPSDDTRAPNPLPGIAVGAAAVLLAALMAACSAGGATPSAASIPARSADASASGPIASGPIPTPILGASAAATGGSGDVTPDYLDITALRTGSASGQLTLSMDLAGAVPTGTPGVGLVGYTFSLDVDVDGTEDYGAALKLAPGGGFQPSLTNRRTGTVLDGPAYPGTATLAGRTITLTVPLEALGCPPTVRVRAQSDGTQAGTTVSDRVPDAETDWIAVSTGCQPAAS